MVLQVIPKLYWYAMSVVHRIQVRMTSSASDAKLMDFVDKALKTITTRSKPDAFPSLLRAKRSAVQTLTAEDMQQDALSSDPCPDCGTMMRFHTAQLRSADEGTTVFYSCENCGHKHTTNNWEAVTILDTIAAVFCLLLEHLWQEANRPYGRRPPLQPTFMAVSKIHRPSDGTITRLLYILYTSCTTSMTYIGRLGCMCSPLMPWIVVLKTRYGTPSFEPGPRLMFALSGQQLLLHLEYQIILAFDGNQKDVDLSFLYTNST